MAESAIMQTLSKSRLFLGRILFGRDEASLAARGSAWVMGSYAFSQVLRFGANVMLARLLYPAAFGQMALVNIVMQGLSMLSDIGVGPGVIRSSRANDRRFLNTAWTLQVIRGFIMAAACIALAFPVAGFFNEPVLMELLPVASLTAVIGGFSSTRVYTANRAMAVGRVSLVELISSVVSTLAVLALAVTTQSIWALLAGGLTLTFFKTLLSHILLPGEVNRFDWEPEAISELSRFGRWIFLTTAMNYFALAADRLLLGKIVDVVSVGVYAVAWSVCAVPFELVQQLCSRVLFPLYRKADGGSESVLVARNARYSINAAATVISLVLLFGGSTLIGLFYDDRYSVAGMLIQLMSGQLFFGCLSSTASPILMVRGNSRSLFVIQLVNCCSMLSLVAVLGINYGVAGVAIGSGLSKVVVYSFVVAMTKCEAVVNLRHDFGLVMTYLAAVVLAMFLGVV